MPTASPLRATTRPQSFGMRPRANLSARSRASKCTCQKLNAGANRQSLPLCETDGRHLHSLTWPRKTVRKLTYPFMKTTSQHGSALLRGLTAAWVVLIYSAFADQVLAASEAPPGFVALFNGKDLTDWRGGETFDHR